MEIPRNTFREADLKRYYDKRDAEINDQILDDHLTSIEDAINTIENAKDELEGLADEDDLHQMEGALGELNRLVYKVRRDNGI